MSATTYDAELRQITGAAATVQMPRASAALLDLLLSQRGRLISRERAYRVLHGAWQSDPVQMKSFDVAICRLRGLLALSGSDWRIETVRQSGWVLEWPA